MSKTNKILLIEDDLAIIDVYKTVLDAAGIGCEIITWGKEAIERIKEIQEGKREKPALVLLDLILPDINGMEILKEIKGNEKTKDITVFILSNYTYTKIEETGDIKADKFILKTGITPTQLVAMIKEQLKLK